MRSSENALAWWLCEVEAGGHVELEASVGFDVGPEERGECVLFVGSDAVVELWDFEHCLEKERVDVHERRLEQVESEHGGFGVFSVGSGVVAVSVEHDAVADKLLLDDLKAAVDLAS